MVIIFVILSAKIGWSTQCVTKLSMRRPAGGKTIGVSDKDK